MNTKSRKLIAFAAFLTSSILLQAHVCSQQLDDPSAHQEQALDSGQHDQNASRKKLADRLVAELDQLIPGIYAADSESYRKLQEIAGAFVARDDAKVRQHLSELATADPNVPPQELLMAGMAFATNNGAQGKIMLERAAAIHRDHPAIALAFARLALLQGRFFDALVLSEKADSLNEKSSSDADTKKFYEIATLDSLTTIELRRNQLQQASALAKQWEQLDSTNDKMLLTSAEIRFLKSQIEPAMEYLARRSDQQKKELPAEFVVAKWYLAKNDLDNHATWIQSAYEKHAENPLTQIEYSAWLLRHEDFEKAIQIVEKYENDHGESAESQLIRGRIAFSRQDYQTAEARFAELYSRQPDNHEISYLYSIALLENNDVKKQQQGVALAQRNYQMLPGNHLAAAALGWALVKTGNGDVGKRLLEQVSRAGKYLPDTAYFLASVMKQEDRKTQAKIILAPYIDTPQIFLFRSRAVSLLESIAAEENLPDPDSSK